MTKDTKDVKAGGKDSKEVDTFARIIFGEATNDTEEGKRAIADCLVNRVKHPAYPNTLSGVLGAKGAKGKFACPTLDNKSHSERYTAAKKPTANEHWAYLDSVAAAQEALSPDRVDTIGGATEYVKGTVDEPATPLEASLDAKKWLVGSKSQVGEHVFGVVTKVDKK